MKKALVILMALALVFAAFADGPDVTPQVTTFTGSATIGYGIDLDANTFGMYNSTATELEIQFVGGETIKSTSGSGIWGEIEIEADSAQSVENTTDADLPVAFNVPAVVVNKAKIHFSDMIAVSILKPSILIGGADATFATGAAIAGVADVGTDVPNAAGFTVEINASPVAINLTVADNGEVTKDAKELGFAADVTVTPIDGLSVYAGATYYKKAAFAANASYALALNDTMTLTPTAAVTYADKVAYVAGAFLGWGATSQEPGFAFVADDTADGVSVAINNDKDFVVGAYDSVFLADFGLKYAADYTANLDTVAKGTLNTGVQFAKTFDIFDVSAHADFTTDLAADTNDYKYGVGVSNSTLIANTTLAAGYEAGKDIKGRIDLTAKISF